MLVYGNKLVLPTIVSRFLHMHNIVKAKKRKRRKALPAFLIEPTVTASNYSE